MLIDSTYFTFPLTIDTDPSGNGAVAERLTAAIERYQPEVLEKVLGYDLYTAFTAGLLLNPVPQKWLNLSGGVGRWRGIVNTATKRSLIANYVYFMWLRDQATQTSGIGEVVTKSANSERVSPAHKQRVAWNDMVDMIDSLKLFLRDNATVYPEYVTDFQRYAQTFDPYLNNYNYDYTNRRIYGDYNSFRKISLFNI